MTQGEYILHTYWYGSSPVLLTSSKAFYLDALFQGTQVILGVSGEIFLVIYLKLSILDECMQYN